MDNANGVDRPFVGYSLSRVAVALDLNALTGPLQGRWQLPLHLDSSARALYDFGSPADRAAAYQLILLEAGSSADHERWLDRDELLRLWPELYLPRVVRAAWQAEHLVLSRIGAGPDVPQVQRPEDRHCLLPPRNEGAPRRVLPARSWARPARSILATRSVTARAHAAVASRP